MTSKSMPGHLSSSQPRDSSHSPSDRRSVSGGNDRLPSWNDIEFILRESSPSKSPQSSADSPADGKSTRVMLHHDGQVPVFEPMTRIADNLVIMKELGRGGMGEVYVAWHELLECEVAVKTLSRESARQPHARERFLRGMRVQLQADSHEHVVGVRTAGEFQGWPYLVMDYVVGTNLSRYVRRNHPLPWRKCCDLVRQAALGLVHIHSQGIVHRDIKPSNLIRMRSGKVKILDWGLAQASQDDVEKNEVTSSGMALGTLDYMAPEQASDAKGVGPRSDLYGLGCTSYYLLSGRAPFAHKSSDAAKLLAHQQEPPPSLLRLRPDVPPAVITIVERLMAKAPQDRYPSAQEVVEAIDRQLNAPPSAIGALVSSARNCLQALGHPVVWIGLAAILLVGVAAFAIPLMSSAPSPLTANATISHFRPGEKDFELAGELGTDSFAPRVGDFVKFQAALEPRAYSYWIAFPPDGKPVLCYPESETVSPSATDESGYEFSFDHEGPGLMVLALVISKHKLPSYQEFLAQHGPPPWTSRRGGISQAVWPWTTGAGLGKPMTPPTRGKGYPPGSEQEAFAELAKWLEAGPKVELVKAWAFNILDSE